MSDSINIAYAAHTTSYTFLLDAEGICRRVIGAPNGKRTAPSAARCVGAQYVASLDPNVSGMLAKRPRVGSAMLFACVDDRGRVSLVRTGLVTRFERRTEDPFAEVEKAPSMSVQTSAPMLPPSTSPRKARVPRQASRQDVYEEGANDRTQPFQTLRVATLQNLRESALRPQRYPVPPQGPVPRRDEPSMVRPRPEPPTRPLDPAWTPRSPQHPPTEKIALGRGRGGR